MRQSVVIYRIYPAVLLHTLFAFIITYINERTRWSLEAPNVMLTVLGLVVGFGISYRASQGFDRFNAGRARWSDMIRISRQLGRCIWDHVPERIGSEAGLIQAFCVATKHSLRGESGIFWEDLYDLVAWPGATYGTFAKRPPTQPLLASGARPATVVATPEKPAGPHVLRSLIFGYTTVSALFPKLFPAPSEDDGNATRRANECKARELGAVRKYHPALLHSRHGKKEGEVINLPLMILSEMSLYLGCLERRGSVPGPVVGASFGCLAAFEDCLTGMEQILTTPLPVVYSVHLRQTVWIYLLALPVQLVGVAGWFTVPVLTIASFLFLGFLAAGEELSQPFGWDENDIDLDLLCAHVIRADLEEITTRIPPPVESKEWFVSAHPPPSIPGSSDTNTVKAAKGGDIRVEIR
ncbi:hypothetical protein RQP46_001795 [Phenoliferia psychrophenolica]